MAPPLPPPPGLLATVERWDALSRWERSEVGRALRRLGWTYHLQDPLFVAGTVLYWGEGAKTSHPLALSNADPAALRLFVSWVREFHDADAAFVLSLHLHHGNDEDAARRWWAAALDLKSPCFTKTYVKPSGTGHRKNHLPHGVCKVRMRRSSDAWFRTMAWIDVLATTLAPGQAQAGLLSSRRVASSTG